MVQLADALYVGDDVAFALADALEETGHSQLAEHFREPEHPKGCWAMDLIMGKVVEPLRASGGLSGDYNVGLAGTADKLRSTWTSLKWNLALAVLITYLLMAATFESWLYPFVVIVTGPIGAVGGFMGLWLLNLYVLQSLDVLTMLHQPALQRNMPSPVARHQSGLMFADSRACDVSRATRPALYDNLLLPDLGQLRPDQAREKIRAAARRERNHQHDGLVGMVLSKSGVR